MSLTLPKVTKSAREKSRKTVNEMSKFCADYDKLFEKHICNPTLDSARMLEEIKRNSQNAFTLFYDNKKKLNHVKHLYSDGLSNAETFRPYKSKKKNPTRLIENDKTITIGLMS